MSTTNKKGRGVFFSSCKSFALAFGWDWDELEEKKDSRWEYIQLLDAILSKRVNSELFQYLITANAKEHGLLVEEHSKSEIGVKFIRISSNAEVDKIGLVAKSLGMDREFIESWNEEQINLAFGNLAKGENKKGVLWIVANDNHLLSRPTNTTETLGEVKTSFVEEYLS